MKLRLCKLIINGFCLGFEKYGLASRIGGSSTDGLYQIYAGKYVNQALYKIKQEIIKQGYGTTILTTAQECIKCVQKLKKIKNIVAWDTQTIDLDIKNECPIGKGRIIAASFFAGGEYDFGNGPKVFIDNFGINAGLINIFKEYLENQSYLKVWHNYGFDRHVFYNHGINVKGFGGDTMHMARLYDSSKMFGEYSLAALTKEYRVGLVKITEIYNKLKTKLYTDGISNPQSTQQQKQQYGNALAGLQKYLAIRSKSSELQKIKIDQLFKRKKILKGGQEGKTYQFPTTLTLHTKQEYVAYWIAYSVLDSESTFFLRQALQLALKNQKSKQYPGINNIWQVYQRHWRPFGELLTDMQREGFKINLQHMKTIQLQAMQRIKQKKQEFMNFLFTFQHHENIDYFNPSSAQQLQHLLHAPYKIDPNVLKKKQKEDQSEDQEIKQLKENAEDGEEVQEKKVVKREKITELPHVRSFLVSNTDKQRGNAKIPMQVVGLGIPPISLTPAGLPSVDEAALLILAGTPSKQKYGKAYDHFKSIGYEQFGKDLCKALEALMDHRHTETLLQTFIQPLQGYTDENHRIHCSLNINTETGRLSSRKPNLQNQPALQKDIYKIRSAFTCDKGNKLIVADYSQLELRVLAHLSNCKAMIDSFLSGGDFHSRTAIGMFDYIKKDIQSGKVVLQWDKNKGVCPVPLLKQKYQAQRRKAKTVNFSIAYGKTPRGFASDWNCSLAQAKNVINSWFKDRPEVQDWQKKKQNIAKTAKITQTLIGRYRKLDRFFGKGIKGSYFGMGLRRAINTPIQGGAADIVVAAMVNIHKNEQLKKLGWRLLLQIHDELILQGPEQSAEKAMKIVKYLMSHPFQKNLLVQLEVQAKIGDSWYECK